MSKSNYLNSNVKTEIFEPTNPMQIPKISNADNFRIDQIIDEYRMKINSIAKMIIPERKEPPSKLDSSLKNLDIIAKNKLKKENRKIMKINDAIVDKLIIDGKNKDQKNHQNLITKLVKGDSKFMYGVPQIKSIDGYLLNSPFDKKKLETSKNKSIVEMKNNDDNYEKKILDIKKINNQNSNCINKKNNLNTNKDDLFLTGVASGSNNNNMDFLFGDTHKECTNKIENILHKNTNINFPNVIIQSIHDLNDKEDSTKIGLMNIDHQNLNNITNSIRKENIFKLFHNNSKGKNLKDNKNMISDFEKIKNDMEKNNDDSDIISDDNRYMSITKQKKNRIKSFQNLDSIKGIYINHGKYNNLDNIILNNQDNLDKLKNKSDFFKMSLKTRSLKNLQNPKLAKKEKKFIKTNYKSKMNDFLSAVNTEVNCFTQTFTDIERGIKNFDFIQSVHVNIPPDKILDKKMMYNDEKFIRKYFIYGCQGGQFISEDKTNDDIIERSDNLAKITPEISYKFKKLIMDKFSVKPIVDFGSYLEPNSYKMSKLNENSKKVASLIDDTDKRRARVENDLSNFFLKSKEV